MNNPITTVTALMAYNSGIRREKKIGYRINLNGLTDNWINGAMLADMTRVWHGYGLKVSGNNYFTIGGISNSKSSRFDHTSPYYQAWLGGYMAKLDDPKSWELEDHFKLALADQKGWLKTYYDPNPYAEVDFSSVKSLGKITISGYQGELFQGCIWSHTDVGERSENWFHNQFMNGFAYVYNKCSLVPSLKGEHLAPNWSPTSTLESFQKILLEGYVAIVNVSPIHKAVLYGNGCHFKDKNGTKVNTYKSIKNELIDLMQQTSIVTV